MESGGGEEEQSALLLPEHWRVDFAERGQSQRPWLPAVEDGAPDVGREERELKSRPPITEIVFGARSQVLDCENLPDLN